ncbi:YaaC family protein [Aneurinibacillus sp. Ricciae_BoGa-3]|uniref:YaaC family protein n=1 Tax=Aneurinibacillus sp. Ricciae_BoGa-3 TaxID=3022697 RepID=UPI0023417BAA|nr:YaaC family protein [Aneurinibacillus sp. Ricciae_BoGa-3]WCK54533.1 YaaC family protein [Aneurinibacillus sp. Ricciae_BoGa-3]
MLDSVHTIRCENPLEKMWDSFLFFESESTTKSFLGSVYERSHPEKAAVHAFQNTSKFIYYIKQARQYYRSAQTSDILVRPLLLYYGMVSLIKAFLVTRDPDYPSSSKVLQHGLTNRKIKKSFYSFAEEEVKVQKDGLLPHLCKFINQTPLGDKYKVQDLLAIIPELQTAYRQLYKTPTLVEVIVTPESGTSKGCTPFYLPESVLDSLHLTLNGFIHYINRWNKGMGSFKTTGTEIYSRLVKCEWHHPNGIDPSLNGQGFENPLFIADFKGNFYFRLNNEIQIDEIINHYMVMYVLGMMCRYETERWGEIIFSFASEDMYMIHEFLSASARKFPNMIYDLLLNQRHIFLVN